MSISISNQNENKTVCASEKIDHVMMRLKFTQLGAIMTQFNITQC